MASAAVNSFYGQPSTFQKLEGSIFELAGWNFAELLLLNRIEGKPCRVANLSTIKLRNAEGDMATLVETEKPELMELVHTRRLKPWVRPENGRVRDAIEAASEVFPVRFIFMVDYEMQQINISSMINLSGQPAVIAVELLKLRWNQANRLYRTSLAGVVSPFRHQQRQ